MLDDWCYLDANGVGRGLAREALGDRCRDADRSGVGAPVAADAAAGRG